MKVKVVNKSGIDLPQYATEFSAGMDVRAAIDAPVVLEPLQRAMIPTGLYLQIPEGYEVQVRPRSGLAAKKGITVLNAPGTIDADYRGQVCVILVNLSSDPFTVERGERVAQLVLAKHEIIEWEETDTLEDSARGDGGFGSTGTK